MSTALVDLHSHLLPSVDDGSRSVEQSREVGAAMLRNGISDVCLTPHLAITETAELSLEVILAQHSEAFRLLTEYPEKMPRLHRGVELMLNEPLQSHHKIDGRLTLAGSRYVLVEFPRTLSASAMRGLLRQVAARGLIPVVAHPERYAEASSTEVSAWRDLGAAIQVDATTIIEQRTMRGARARTFVQAGLADILAADNHGDERMISTADAYLRSIGAERQADQLLRVNPRAMIEDRAVDPPPPFTPKISWWGRLRRVFSYAR